MILSLKCPMCEWSVRQETEPERKDFMRSYMAKGLIGHMLVKHARHAEIKQAETGIGFSTLVGKMSGEGMVEMNLNEEVVQMDLDKAREVHRMLGECIEAAASDWLINKFFTEKVGFDQEKAAMVLMDFRELRHGVKKGEKTN